jgi:glycosyltransferase involved in cell wall biosynthesis
MIIIKKLKTAKMVILKYGAKEALGLFGDNVEKAIIRFFRLSKSFLNRFVFNHKRNNKINILYVTNLYETEHGQTVRYRIYNLIEALKGKAQTSFEIIENGIYKNKKSIKQADIIILMRIMWTKQVEQLINTAKENNIPVVYDIDDLIFLPEYAENFSIIVNEQKKKSDYLRDFKKYEKAFQSCDYATTSTQFIAEQMKKENKKTYLIYNGLNYTQLKIAIKTKKTQGNLLYISYLSGSKTHDKDFGAASPALEKIVNEYNNVRIRIVGYLSTKDLPLKLLQKTETMCYMSWKRLLRESAKNFINIAPLDIENPFCHAKSELKFYEAAVVGVPSVCSNTDTYNRCIKHGVNGMLASTDEEWYNAIKLLIEDKALYNTIVENGYKYVQSHYTPPAIADMAMSAYTSIIEQFSIK